MKAEKLIAQTINNEPLKIDFRGKELSIPRPTLGTIIAVSKEIAEFPDLQIGKDYSQTVQTSLAVAKDCSKLTDIVAMLILGKKRFKTQINLFGLTITIRDNVKRLSKEIENLTAKETSDILVKIFASMDCAFFLGTIISLEGVNHLKRTTTETTASGQKSPVS